MMAAAGSACVGAQPDCKQPETVSAKPGLLCKPFAEAWFWPATGGFCRFSRPIRFSEHLFFAMTRYLAWAHPPAVSELAAAAAPPGRKVLAVCLPDTGLPQWRQPENPSAAESALSDALQAVSGCIQFADANFCARILPDTDLLLLPEAAMRRLREYLPQMPEWQGGEELAQEEAETPKPWLGQPENRRAPQRVLVVGAGIAGAATAYELAVRGVEVCVLEAASAPASAASGNRQGLLYAKISPHPTMQTELLLCGYGYTRRLLDRLLPDRSDWQPCGVLHLDYSDAERRRNAALAAQVRHRHLYRCAGAAEASELAGVPLETGGLWWPQGAWIHPAALVRALLSHPNIRLHTASPLTALDCDGNWQAYTPNGRFSGSHIVFCAGADSPKLPLIGGFAVQPIRGQTAVAAASPDSRRLRCALSGASYISPAWQDAHCFGATFAPQDGDGGWRDADEAANRAALAGLNPFLYQSLRTGFSGCLPDGGSLKEGGGTQIPRGHAAVRCDSFDHLPLVGALGDPQAMRRVYAKLASDKNYRIDAPCPYYPDAYANTAHGSRGLATAPVCAAQTAAEICGTARPLPQRIASALHPNRLVVRSIVRGGR